jgi:putative ABC transport system permease protein
MEFGPILRTLFRNKTRMILIVMEVALTLAIVVNCINMMQDMRYKMERPTGIDEENIITIYSHPFSKDFLEDGYFENARRSDLEFFRSLPGVISAEAFTHIPLSGSGSSMGRKPLGSDMNTVPTAQMGAGPYAVETLGVEIISGRNLREDDINDSDSKNVLITKAFADVLFPDGNAVGKQLQGRTAENPNTIVGIIGYMHGFWPGWPYLEHVLIEPSEPGGFSWGVDYMVRVEPGQLENLVGSLETKMLALNDGRNVNIQTFSEVKSDSFETERAIVKILRAVIALLIFVTALGMIGLTSFSVTERIHHIGTRRALGARKLDIIRYFLTENWIVTSLGILLGTVFTFGFNYLLVSLVSGVKLDWMLLVHGILIMWAVGQFSAFFPAWKGARISPAVATRSI